MYPQDLKTFPHLSVEETAKYCLNCGLSVIPVKMDKSPALVWRTYTQHRMEVENVPTLFSSDTHLALVCGGVSGNVEAIDMDLKYDLTGELQQNFEDFVNAQAPDLLSKLVIQCTRNQGLHYIYRCEKVGRNEKLADRYTTETERELHPHQQNKVLIETRGEGGYVVIAPSQGYTILQGNFGSLPILTEAERDVLFSAARSMNEVLVPYSEPNVAMPDSSQISPWEDYNERGNVLDLLLQYGWTIIWQKTDKIALKRPGDSQAVHSAYYSTTTKLFSVFSTSTQFEVKKGYKPAAVFAMLVTNGNFTEAAKQLRGLGYGSPLPQKEQSSKTETPTFSESLREAPHLPEALYLAFPNEIQEVFKKLSNQRQQDIVLISALSVLGACFHPIHGVYDKRTVYPNLFSFIIAPPANGKGVMTYAQQLAEHYHQKIRRENTEQQKCYQAELRAYQNANKKKESNHLEMPQKPPIKALFVPGDSSSASVKQLLAASNGIGIMFETEADTVANTLKKDFGGYSDLLRKSFHHESISYARKVTDEYVVIDQPKLSVALAGTPNQLGNLITSFEDGLFSRFIFYCFSNDYSWKDVSIGKEESLEIPFDKAAAVVGKLTEHIHRYPFTFGLTDPQWDKLNKSFEEYLKNYTEQFSEVISSIVWRQGNICFRVAMILTALHYASRGEMVRTPSQIVYCEDAHCEAAIQFAGTCIEHAFILLNQYAKHEEGNNKEGAVKTKGGLQPLAKRWLSDLPKQFTRKEAVETGRILGIASSTIDKYLQKLMPTYLQKGEQYGIYQRC